MCLPETGRAPCKAGTLGVSAICFEPVVTILLRS
jgi:hypothetical protein